MPRLRSTLALAVLLLAACSDATGPTEEAVPLDHPPIAYRYAECSIFGHDSGPRCQAALAAAAGATAKAAQDCAARRVVSCMGDGLLAAGAWYTFGNETDSFGHRSGADCGGCKDDWTIHAGSDDENPNGTRWYLKGAQ